MKTLKPFLVLAVVLLMALPLAAQEGGALEGNLAAGLEARQQRLTTLSQQLLLLEPYVTVEPDHTVTLDVEAARNAGFSEEVLQLAQEMADAQNEAVERLLSKKDESLTIDVAGRENLEHFLGLAQEANDALARGYLPPAKAGSTNACGTFDNPVPKVAGPRYSQGLFKTRADAAAKLVGLGFHSTAWYVNTPDYTRGRSYVSTWGTCSSPRFRDQGTINTNGSKYEAKIQYGECNPEVFSYSWPYWNWGAYCAWWHYTH